MSASSAHEEYDVIVLGAGSTGENVADRAVQGGLSAIIVESELVGGECSYWACMPSKALLRPAQALRAARLAPGAAEAVTGELDVQAVLDRRDKFASNWSDDGQVKWLDSAKIRLARGHGRLSGVREVTVTAADGSTRVLTARHAVAIATGSSASIPPIDGLHEAEPWTSREATSAEKIPTSLVIIGGGVVGSEMATAYAGFGCEVTVIARGALLENQEPFAGEMVTDSLRELGATIILNADVVRVHRDGDHVSVHTEDGREFVAEEVLVATGRSPRTGDIGLDTIAVDAGGYLEPDDTMLMPGFDWLYAVGDVNGRALLTHQGKYQARAAGDAIVARAAKTPLEDAPWGRHVATADHAAVPQVTFTEPEVASIGLTEAAAREAGHTIEVIDSDIAAVAGASLRQRHYRGKARLVIDTEREIILGATFVGPDVSELLHSATIAVVGEVPISRLWHAVPSYPTVSEVWLRLLEAYGRKSA